MTAFVVLAAFAWLSWNAYTEYKQIVEQEYRLLEVGARQREARLSGALRSVDLMLQTIGEDWVAARNPDQVITPAVLIKRMRQLPEVRSLLVTDAAGHVVTSNLRGVARLNVSDREYYLVHRKGSSGGSGFHISRPFKTRTSGLFVVTVSRALRDSRGRFLGVIVATLDPKLFEEILRIRENEPDSFAALINREGDVISIVPPPSADLVGQTMRGGIDFTAHRASGSVMTRHLTRPKLPQLERAAVFLDMPRTGLTVITSRDYQTIFAAWRTTFLMQVTGFFAVAGVALFLAALAVRRQRNLENAHEFSRNLIETANVMVVGLDEAGRVAIFNAAAEQLTGYQRAEIIGRSWFDSVVPHEHLPEAWQEFKRFTESGETGSQSNPILTKNGEIRHIAWQSTRLKDHRHGVATLSFGRDITEQQAAEKELMRLATTDTLTGLANRRHFVHALDLELARIKRHAGMEAAVCMCDLDHFKQINDSYGHAVGDAVLQAFADCLREPLRRTDLAGRFGGEEFCLLLPGTNQHNAQILAERLRQRMSDTAIATDGQSVSVTVSIGVTVLSKTDASPDDALGRADAALYAAKNQGRDRVVGWERPDVSDAPAAAAKP
ncbi:MAG: diguanylate cyclase [Syntrophales bacterium]